MLLKRQLQLKRVILITWKVDLLMIFLCTVAYFVDTLLLTDVQIPPGLPALMGTALAFFIGFNNNQAYNRWWEARTIWGELVNHSREWARSMMAYTSSANTTKESLHKVRQKMIFRHIAFLYALQFSLRKSNSLEYEKYLANEEADSVKAFVNKPNAILDIQSKELEKMTTEKVIDNFRFYAMAGLIANFGIGMGKSERINNTVFPTVYVYFTRLFIWIFVILLTMSISTTVGPWSIFFGWVMGFVFHITHINGMSIMNPFEDEPPGVPITSITRTIEINMLQTLGEKKMPEPILPVNDEYIL
ncbi:MAG TPA: bestrophin family ion channel [Cyclobacteriaceae bacterium]|jgi:putative membrane protein|nr:bestrophin family ion channel [Cyclobacteriaceae bacterium]